MDVLLFVSQVVSVLAFYSDVPSSNPAEAFSVNFECKKYENNKEEAGAHFLKTTNVDFAAIRTH